MLKRLKRRFVILSMLIVGILLAVFYITICTLLFVNITQGVKSSLKNFTSDSILSAEVENIGVDADDDNFNLIDKENVLVVDIEKDGTIKKLDFGNASMSENSLKTAVNAAMSSEYSFGNIMEIMLFYSKSNTPDGTRIAFADSGRYFRYMKLLVEYGGVLCGITMLVLFIISNIFASFFITPIKKNWEEQKNFIADASHELKTPLTVILANCKILEAHPDSTVSEQQKWIKSTDEEASHMKELVNKLLFLAKNDSVKAEKICEPVDISDLTTSLALQFEPVAYECGVTVNSNIEKGIVIHSDPTAVNQIVHILIDNAVKYAGIGGEVNVSLRKKNKSVYLYTKNTGEPISEEDIQHIFERFYRTDKARTSGNGYGLGLAICSSLVNSIGAEISVVSDRQSGTVFTVKFKAK